MKKLLSLAAILVSVLSFSGDKNFSDIIADGKWYNDEYSFTFSNDKKFKAYYTFGKDNGMMTGTYKVKDNSVTLTKENVTGIFNTEFMPAEKIELSFTEDLTNPKSTRLLRDAADKITLWNDTAFVTADTKISVEPNAVECISLGYKLSATTDNVRIRKGPGTDFEYMTFVNLDPQTKEIKVFGSVQNGTNIRLLARTVQKMKVNEWFNYWYYVEYKEPKDNSLTYKTAWMFGEFVNVPENKDREITITSPENEESIYGARTIEIKGTVTGAPVKMKIQVKDSFGIVLSEKPITDYNQEEGTFSVEVSKDDSNLFIGSNTYKVMALYSDKKASSKQISVYLHESAGEMAKPVIYLYPETNSKISVKVNPKNGISVSIPPYKTGWTADATPEGKLTVDGKHFSYLFWESENYTFEKITNGFVVKKENLNSFFTEKLSTLGLNKNEINDFLEFWIPILSKSDNYLIHFYDTEAVDKYAPLQISPKPDSVIRVFFDSKPVDASFKIPEQKLVPVKEKDFPLLNGEECVTNKNVIK